MSLYMVIILFVIGLCGIYFFIILYTRFMVSYMVGNKHALLELIIRTGEVPNIWRRNLNTKGNIKKLDDLILYVKTTNLIDDESTRTSYLTRLDEVRILWADDNASHKAKQPKV